MCIILLCFNFSREISPDVNDDSGSVLTSVVILFLVSMMLAILMDGVISFVDVL